MPLFVKQGGSWRESPKGYTFAPKRFPGEQGPDFSFGGVRYRSFFNDGNTNAPVDVDSGGGAYDKDWTFAEHSFTFREGVPIRFEWFLGTVKPSGYQYSDSGTMILRAWVAKAGVTRGFNTFGSKNNGGSTSSLDGMQRVFQKGYSRNIPWGGGIFDFQTNTTISPQRIRELIPDVHEGMNLKLYFSVHIRRFGTGPSVHVRGQRLRIYELVRSVNRNSPFKQIWVAKGGEWRALWNLPSNSYQGRGLWNTLAGDADNHRANVHRGWAILANPAPGWVSMWGSSISYLLIQETEDRSERPRPITGIKMKAQCQGGYGYAFDIIVTSWQELQRIGIDPGHRYGYRDDGNVRFAHEKISVLGVTWGNNGRGEHHVSWSSHGMHESPMLNCHVPVGEAMIILFRIRYGDNPSRARDLRYFEIVDVRYG